MMIAGFALPSTHSFTLPQISSNPSPSYVNDYGSRCPISSTQRQSIQPSRRSLSESQTTQLWQSSSSHETTVNQRGKRKSARLPGHSLLPKEEQQHYLQLYQEYKRVKSILSSLGKSPSLREQAKACGYDVSNVLELRRVLKNGPQTKETLILHNVGLVHYVVQQILSSPSGKYLRSLSRDDLIQEGTIGLSRALEKYEYSANSSSNKPSSASFSTYAVYWIRASILRCIAQREELVRVPEHVTSAIRKVTEAMKDLGIITDMNGDVSIMEGMTSGVLSPKVIRLIAAKAGLTEVMVKEALQVKKRRQWAKSKGSGYVELEDWMFHNEGSGSSVQRRKVLNEGHDDMYNPFNGLDREGKLKQVKDMLSPFLSGKELEALSWRYGLKQQEVAEEDALEQSSGFHDYEAEAEKDLFGPNGILSAGGIEMSKPSRHQTKGGRWGEAMSFAEVGEQMRVSAEYGRRLCSRALKKLQMAAEEGRLDPALLF